MPVTTIDGDVLFNWIGAATWTPPNACVADVAVFAGAAGNYIQASKCQQMWVETYAQESATQAAADTRVLHQVPGKTATILAFRGGCAVAPIAGNITTLDLRKNGTSILVAPITLAAVVTPPTVPTLAYTIYTADLSVAAAVKGDVLELVITITGAGGAYSKGTWGQVVLFEDPF